MQDVVKEKRAVCFWTVALGVQLDRQLNNPNTDGADFVSLKEAVAGCVKRDIVDQGFVVPGNTNIGETSTMGSLYSDRSFTCYLRN